MNIACPGCRAIYRIDPARIADAGAQTRCRECGALFHIERHADTDVAGVVRYGTAVAVDPPSGADPGGDWGADPVAGSGMPVAEAHDDPSSDAEVGVSSSDAEVGVSSSDAEVGVSSSDTADGTHLPETVEGRAAFGPQDPETRALRLARALVSDIKAYHRERWEASRGAGTLRADFRDEILRSWREYVGQVGESTAKGTPHFRDALNDILAEGERVF
jgi:predicted Zn finger-like uncharacterized protein